MSMRDHLPSHKTWNESYYLVLIGTPFTLSLKMLFRNGGALIKQAHKALGCDVIDITSLDVSENL